MKKRMLLVLLAAALALTGCAGMGGGGGADATPRPEMTARMYETREDAFAMYDQVTFDDTVESLSERFGEPIVETDSNGESYTWLDGDRGVVAVFFSNGRLRSKLVYFEDFRQFGKISDAQNVSGVLTANKEMSLNDMNLLLGGEGVEFIQVAQDASLSPAMNRGYMWISLDGEEVKILFNSKGGIEQVSYSLN